MTLRTRLSLTSVAPVLVAAALVLSACSGNRPPDGPGGSGGPGGTGGPGGPGQQGEQASTPLLFSPNGEPLNGGDLGLPSCSLAVNYWFLRTDHDHDGRIDRAEFLADADTEFHKMDLDQMGVLTSSSIERYRAPYRRTTRGSGTQFDPVMSADHDVNFRVTQQEFRTQANEVFDSLSAHSDGVILPAWVKTYCEDWEKSHQDQGRKGGSARGPEDGPGGRPGRGPL